jgi:AGZA family xanthine/uracil permease-like MFS transporter
MSLPRARYPWFVRGDWNAFFSLMLDNVTNLVILNVILAGGFGLPAEFIFTHMIPGTALGVLIGDLAYTWMARRLALRTGRVDVTAMPLGLDTPSTIGVAVAVIGPVYSASQDPMVAWQVGMATMMFMGLVKLGLAFAGDWVRRVVPQAGLLGSIAAVGVALLGLLPLVNVFKLPVVGLVALGLVLYALVARQRLPGNLPGAAVAVVVGTALYYALGAAGLMGEAFHLPAFTLRFSPPLPTLGFVEGLGQAVDFLPLAIPFGLLTVVGGINVNESARVAGDEYRTRDILLVEALATLAAGLCGGVAQSTPYIGHPAYKAMGARAGYTLATGLFIGLGGALGLVSFIVDALPEAAVAPILIFVGLEITAQAFGVCPRRHHPAVALAFLPVLAYLVTIFLGKFGVRPEGLGPDQRAEFLVLSMLGHGFILTAMLWGAFGAHLADRQLGRAAAFLGVAALGTLFGVIHSAAPAGQLFLPWQAPSPLVFHVAVGYAAVAGMLLVFRASGPRADGAPG